MLFFSACLIKLATYYIHFKSIIEEKQHLNPLHDKQALCLQLGQRQACTSTKFWLY